MSVLVHTDESHATPHRIAFCGAMCAGKTFACRLIQDNLKESTRPAIIISLETAMKNMVFGDDDFDNTGGKQLVGTVGRTIDPDAWVKILLKEIERIPVNESILVDDVRHANEVAALQQLGFTTVYLNTPWFTRLTRLRERLHGQSLSFSRVVGWFTHESELSVHDIPTSVFDHVVETSNDLIACLEELNLKYL